MVHALMNINIFNINNQSIDCRLAVSAVSPVVRCLEAAPQCAKNNSADIEDYNHD